MVLQEPLGVVPIGSHATHNPATLWETWQACSLQQPAQQLEGLAVAPVGGTALVHLKQCQRLQPTQS